MKCSQVSRLLQSDRWMDADPSTMACIREHVHLCARCEGRYGELLSLDERMHGEFRNMLHNTQLPSGIREAWRSQLDTESHQTRPGRSIPFRMARFMAVAAASVVILVVACGLSPTVTLYAGSLPGVGTLLSALGADRGLLMAQHQGLVADVNVSVDSSGVKMTVRKVVGDPTRVVAALELEGKGLAGREGGLVKAELVDQWGKSYGMPTSFSIHETDEDRIQAILTFRGVNVRTRSLSLMVTEMMGVTGNWYVRFPVDFIDAYQFTRTVEPDVSVGLEPSAVSALGLEAGAVEPVIRVQEVVLAPTNTEIRLSLSGFGRAWPAEYELFDLSGNRYAPIGSSHGNRRDGSGEIRLSFEPVRGDQVYLLSTDRFMVERPLTEHLELDLRREDGLLVATRTRDTLEAYGSSISLGAVHEDEEGLHVEVIIEGGSVSSIDIVEIIDQDGLRHRPRLSTVSTTGASKLGAVDSGDGWRMTVTSTYDRRLLTSMPATLTVDPVSVATIHRLPEPVVMELDLPAGALTPIEFDLPAPTPQPGIPAEEIVQTWPVGPGWQLIAQRLNEQELAYHLDADGILEAVVGSALKARVRLATSDMVEFVCRGEDDTPFLSFPYILVYEVETGRVETREYPQTPHPTDTLEFGGWMTEGRILSGLMVENGSLLLEFDTDPTFALDHGGPVTHIPRTEVHWDRSRGMHVFTLQGTSAGRGVDRHLEDLPSGHISGIEVTANNGSTEVAVRTRKPLPYVATYTFGSRPLLRITWLNEQ